MIRTTLPAFLLALLTGCSNTPRETVTPTSSSGKEVLSQPLVDLRIEPLPDYYFFLRRATRDELINVPSFLADALRDLRAVEKAIGDRTSLFERLEAPLGRARTASELEGSYDSVPLEIVSNGEKIPFRELVRTFHRSFREGEPGFLAQVWPAHKKLLEARRATYRQKIHGAQAPIARDLERRLGLTPKKSPASVYMVVESPLPDVHAELPEGGELNAITMNGANDRELIEEAMHALIYSLQSESRGSGTLFDDLTKEMRARGVTDATEPSLGAVVKLAVYTEGAALVRAHVDPAHVPIGATSGLYDSMQALTASVVPYWKQYDAGELGRVELVSGVASRASALVHASKPNAPQATK